MKIPFILAIAVGVALSLSACETTNEPSVESIKGSGNILTVEREVTAFTRIQVYLGADLDLDQGNENSLSIEADDNLMQYIDTRIEDGSLIVSKPDEVNLSPSQRIQLHVSFSSLSAIEIYGSSAITAENLDLDELAVSFSGAGSTELSGTVDTQTLSIQGEATINNFDLVSQQVSVDISGRGTLFLNAEETLNVTVAGEASVRYLGNPVITQNISGTGDIAQQQ